MRCLPRVMVAPNGARRNQSDHAALPVTDAEIIATAVKCQDAGADGIHVHIRDSEGLHEIDAGHYRAVLDQLSDAVPDMYVQVTSEAAGRYSGAEQRAIMRDLQPAYVSVALREMVREPQDWAQAQEFYEWATSSGVDIQHILYSPEDVQWFVRAIHEQRIPGTHHLILLVQGTYAHGSQGRAYLEDYLTELGKADGMSFDWMLCAFGQQETESLARAAQLGGKARVGFENSLWNMDGTLAKDNAERVREVDAAIKRAVQKTI